MSLKDSDRRIIVELELEKAEKTFSQVKVQVEAELWQQTDFTMHCSMLSVLC